MSYLVAGRIDGYKTKHLRHKGNAYPHENRFNNTFSNLIQFGQDSTYLLKKVSFYLIAFYKFQKMKMLTDSRVDTLSKTIVG